MASCPSLQRMRTSHSLARVISSGTGLMSPTELPTGPQSGLHRCLGRGTLEAAHQDGGLAVPGHRDEMQNRDRPFRRRVLEPELSTSRLAAGAEDDLRPRPRIVLVHPRLQHVHRVLQTRLGHASLLLTFKSYARDSTRKQSRIMS